MCHGAKLEYGKLGTFDIEGWKLQAGLFKVSEVPTRWGWPYSKLDLTPCQRAMRFLPCRRMPYIVSCTAGSLSFRSACNAPHLANEGPHSNGPTKCNSPTVGSSAKREVWLSQGRRWQAKGGHMGSWQAHGCPYQAAAPALIPLPCKMEAEPHVTQLGHDPPGKGLTSGSLQVCSNLEGQRCL